MTEPVWVTLTYEGVVGILLGLSLVLITGLRYKRKTNTYSPKTPMRAGLFMVLGMVFMWVVTMVMGQPSTPRLWIDLVCINVWAFLIVAAGNKFWAKGKR